MTARRRGTANGARPHPIVATRLGTAILEGDLTSTLVVASRLRRETFLAARRPWSSSLVVPAPAVPRLCLPVPAKAVEEDFQVVVMAEKFESCGISHRYPTVANDGAVPIASATSTAGGYHPAAARPPES